MKKVFIISFLTVMFSVTSSFAVPAIMTDERVKTFVFDSSEIYRVNTRSGFQTTIEFNQDETIDTMSIGNSIGWQLTPAGRRLFIKPLHKTGITNLSVITNRRTYQFELISVSSDSMTSSHAYVVRFYYPDQGSNYSYTPEDRTRGSTRPVSQTAIPNLDQMMAPPVIMQQPVPKMYNPLPGSYR
jgi:type IV secretion system protein VirB9